MYIIIFHRRHNMKISNTVTKTDVFGQEHYWSSLFGLCIDHGLVAVHLVVK